jgi:hypothetical protein
VVVIVLFGTLAACTTPPRSTVPDIPGSSWKTETFFTSDPVVSVNVVILDPPPPAAQVVGRVRGDGAVYLGTTPWRRTLTGRRPVGVVVASGQVTSKPAAPYWAVALRDNGSWEMVPQENLDRFAPGDETGEIQVAVGGFYPLIREGRVASGEFPGTRIRAARVAIGGTEGDDPRLVIVAAEGGLTTGELARVLQRYDLDWALNLDGGRSAYLRFPNGALRPQGVFLRRRGPVLLRLLPPDPDRPPREMIE